MTPDMAALARIYDHYAREEDSYARIIAKDVSLGIPIYPRYIECFIDNRDRRLGVLLSMQESL